MTRSARSGRSRACAGALITLAFVASFGGAHAEVDPALRPFGPVDPPAPPPVAPCAPLSACTWDRTFGGASDDKIASAIADERGYFVAGNSRLGAAGAYDGWVLRLDAAGETLWSRTLGGDGSDQLRALAPTPDGGVIAAGHSQNVERRDVDAWIVALSAEGETIFERVLGGVDNDAARAAAAAPDGGAFIAGYTISNADTRRDAWVARLDASGEPLWSRTFGAAGIDDARDVVAAPDGGAIVIGHRWGGPARSQDVLLLRLSPDGDTLWRRVFEAERFEAGTAVAATADGGVLAVAHATREDPRDVDVWAIRLDGAGETLWERRYGGARRDEPWAVAALSDGSALIAAATWSQGEGSSDIWLFKIDAAGEMLWERLFGGVLWDHPSGVLAPPSGGILLSGHTANKGEGFEDGWLLRLDDDGRL